MVFVYLIGLEATHFASQLLSIFHYDLRMVDGDCTNLSLNSLFNSVQVSQGGLLILLIAYITWYHHTNASPLNSKIFPNLKLLSLGKEDAMAISHGLFQAKTYSQTVIPNLELQAITKEDTMIGKGQFGAIAAHLLQNLKVLRLQGYHEGDESNIFSSGLLEKLPSIENLEVVECHGLVYLLTSTTARSLGLLKYMSVLNCQAIQEIVCEEGDQESNDDEITFGQLNALYLESLPSIVGFYTGTSKLIFPLLDESTLNFIEMVSL
ncbi:hypothetical protein CR513_56032, partial [Mucuna pruriens]